MTSRRRIHIDVDLPELTPAQADMLWTFLDNLAADIWDAYESELLQVEEERSTPSDLGDDWTTEELDAGFEDYTPPRSLTDDHDPDPDF